MQWRYIKSPLQKKNKTQKTEKNNPKSRKKSPIMIKKKQEIVAGKNYVNVY